MTTETHNGLPVIGRDDIVENNPTLGPRPAPGEIRFNDDCFEVVAYRCEWKIGDCAPYPSERFTSEAECAARCRRLGRPMPAVVFVPVKRRIRWA